MATRIFIIIIVSSIIILSQLTTSDNKNLNDYGGQFINFMLMYRYPMALANNYIKSFLNVGNQTKINNQLNTATNNMLFFSK
jgi:hypothetical protein